MNNITLASIKIEQPEVYADYPGEEIIGSESSENLLPSNNIKLETFCECDNIQSSREIISEVEVFDKVGSKTNIKIEQPEVYVDYADEDMKIDACSQSCPSLQEQSQMEKKMVFANSDWKPMKHELSDILCQRKSKMVDMASYCSNQEVSGNETESRMSEDTTLIHHQEVSFIGTENGYMASQQHENCSYLSEIVTSMAEIDTKLFLSDENFQLCNVETPIKQTQISRKSLDDAPDYTCGSPQRIQTEDRASMFDNGDVTINVDTFLHRHKTTDPGEKPYMCDDCAASFTQFGTLKYHMRTHTGEQRYKCDDCAASFNRVHNLRCHMRTHTGEKPYKCDVCSASFTQVGKLNCHNRTHTGETPYKCDICAASFTDSRDLKRHRRIHTGEKPYRCDVCAASFTDSTSLKCHTKIHTGEKPYKCDICSKSFTTASKLRCHRRTHTGEKPYKCDVCAASFADSSNFKCHKRTHTGEKLYKCEFCAASFTAYSSLKWHKRIHTREKPFKCDDCTASFTRVGHLTIHSRIHTG